MGWFGKKKDKDGNEVQPSPQKQAEDQLGNAVGAIYAIAILGGIASVIALVFQFEVLLNLGFGVFTLIFAAVYAGLGLWVQKKRSMIGLGIAFGLYLADSIAFVMSNIEAGGRPTAGIAVRAVFAYAMFQGFGALKQLKGTKTNSGASAAEGAGTDASMMGYTDYSDDSSDSSSADTDCSDSSGGDVGDSSCD